MAEKFVAVMHFKVRYFLTSKRSKEAPFFIVVKNQPRKAFASVRGFSLLNWSEKLEYLDESRRQRR